MVGRIIEAQAGTKSVFFVLDTPRYFSFLGFEEKNLIYEKLFKKFKYKLLGAVLTFCARAFKNSLPFLRSGPIQMNWQNVYSPQRLIKKRRYQTPYQLFLVYVLTDLPDAMFFFCFEFIFVFFSVFVLKKSIAEIQIFCIINSHKVYYMFKGV